MKRFLTVLSCCLALASAGQQQNNSDKGSPWPPKHGLLIHLYYGYQFPAGDLERRFGNNSTVGLNVSYKTYRNWVFGAEMNFLYGSVVKENYALDSLMDKDYLIYDVNGNPAVIKLYERGYNAMLTAGKIILKHRKNENSGILLRLGVGFLQHRIHYVTNRDLLPQLNDEYVKGYDRLSNGITTYGFLGYQFLHPKLLLNFVAGVEYFNAYTYNRRKYNYDSRSYDLARRNDQLFGAKVGVIIPLYFKDRDKKNKEIFFK